MNMDRRKDAARALEKLRGAKILGNTVKVSFMLQKTLKWGYLQNPLPLFTSIFKKIDEHYLILKTPFLYMIQCCFQSAGLRESRKFGNIGAN